MNRSGYDFSHVAQFMGLPWDDSEAGFNTSLERHLTGLADALAADGTPMSPDEIADLRDEAIKYRNKLKELS